ncbi:conserved hypothetical protein [Coccidioides posadasii str. Silveira]|uniref:Uncharacterized protein n=2 Tax=Coccidioides posadasii TaxID=199306 RepID=E9CT33_COCPS|nr:conserved hypothetical protein [Coccidioides posadasii str. Silveira]KMM67358.1 hypothetical protein CPAG_03692 [Coccidioides posadasii RMSCC 3488]
MCRVQSLRNDHSYKNASSLSVGRLLVRLEELHVIRTLCMPSVKTKTWHSLNKPERLQASEPSVHRHPVSGWTGGRDHGTNLPAVASLRLCGSWHGERAQTNPLDAEDDTP